MKSFNKNFKLFSEEKEYYIYNLLPLMNLYSDKFFNKIG